MQGQYSLAPRFFRTSGRCSFQRGEQLGTTDIPGHLAWLTFHKTKHPDSKELLNK